MSNLVAFGCSNTIGEGLPDSPPMSEKLSVYSWPALLSNKLNRNLVNNGIPGASNLLILSEIMNYKFSMGDIIVVMWSFPHRDVVFSENQKHTRLGSWSVYSEQIGNFVKEWISSSTEYDLHLRSWLAIHQAHLLLTLLKLKFYFVNIQQDEQFFVNKPNWAADAQFLPFNGHEFFLTMPRADDNIHPGKEWHALIADLLCEEILNV